MAITTRFISTSNAPFVPNNNKMDPGAASAAARAQGAASNQVMNALSGLVSSVGQQQEKVDDLYAARAKADVEVDYNKKYMEASGQIQSGGNFGAQSVQMLQEMAKPYVDNAPNDATRNALIKSFMGLGKSAQIQGDRLQFGINEKTDLQGLVDYASKSSALLTLGKVGEEKAYANLEEMAAGLTGKGYDQQKIQKILGGAKDQVYLQSRLQEATTNPFEVLKAAESGAYVDKGSDVQKHIINAATNVIKGQVGQARSAADQTLDQIYAGKPADDNVSKQLDLMKNLVSQTKDPELTQKYTELALAQKWDADTRNLSLPELDNELFKIEKGAALGNLSPQQAKKFEGVIRNRIEWAKKDGLAFFELQNPTSIVGPLPTPNDSPDAIQQKIASRAATAAAASEKLGMPVAPVKSSELQAVFQNWGKLSVAQQEKQLNAFAAFGPEHTPAIAELAGKTVADMKDKSAEALVPALNLMSLNPAAASDILKGTEKLNKKVVSLELQDTKAQKLLNDSLGQLYVDDPNKRSQYLAAAKAIAANKLAADPSLDSANLIGQALKDISGVIDVEQSTAWYKNSPNYKIVPPEYGLSPETMQNILDSVTPDNLAAYSNGLPVVEDSKGNRVPINESDLQDFQFLHVRGGKYKLVAGNATVMNDQNQPLLFDMKSYFRDNKSKLMK